MKRSTYLKKFAMAMFAVNVFWEQLGLKVRRVNVQVYLYSQVYLWLSGTNVEVS